MIMINRFFIPLLILIFAGCKPDEVDVNIPRAPESVLLSEAIFYEVDLNDRGGDTFKVRVFVDGLTEANDIFQFPATVPGTYSILNIGDYVVDFHAYDENYQLLATENIATNQWRISNPTQTAIIEYEIAETWDYPQPKNFIYKMAGTSIENDHSLLNTFAVFGYPTGLKEKNYYVSLSHPSSWITGTSLERNMEGYYVADDYDHLADSPFLSGDLTNSEVIIDNTEIDVWVYSASGAISSPAILNAIDPVLYDAKAFLNELPVDHYSFLYHFEDQSAGALEHSHSSVYVLREMPLTSSYLASIRDIAAHEFFHIVIPLHIHSEIIEDFNFVTPTPSAHLWLYEGVTEWASHIMQYRNNSIDLTDILNRFSNKIYRANNFYDNDYSLVEISLNSYTPEGGAQFGNIYQRGAVVAALLDIRLLELSNGERGLREVILELTNIYGPENAFPEDQFFNVLVDLTYPEIENFISSYVKGTESLPIQEYFAKLGINYNPVDNSFSIIENPTPEQQYLFGRWSVNL
jgi:predicted metalloprotease with PDZ domain